MAYIKQGNNIILWGRVTKDAQLRHTQSGKTFATMSVQYAKHHDEDGNMIRDYMDVSVWGPLGEQVGDESIGIAKGDVVMVLGTLYRDDRKSEKEGTDVYNINADAVFDSTSIFQVAAMVVDPEGTPEPAINEGSSTERASFYPSAERTPFEEAMDEAEGDLPY